MKTKFGMALGALFVLVCGQNAYAQASFYTGYDDLDEAFYIGLGGETAEAYLSDRKFLFMSLEAGFSGEVIKGKFGVYFYPVYFELGYQTFGLSIGGAVGLTSGVSETFEESNMQAIYELGANLRLGPVIAGYAYGYDEFHKYEYNYVRLGIIFDF